MPVKEYHPAWWVRWIGRPLVRGGLGLLFHILAPIKISGKKNIPRKPYIVAINHVSLYDPPFVGVFWPEQLEAMGAVDIWNKPGQNILAVLWGRETSHFSWQYQRTQKACQMQQLKQIPSRTFLSG